MPEKLVFEGAVEGLFLKAHGDKLTPEIKGELRKVGIDLDKRLLPAYPLETVDEGTRVMRRMLYAHEPDDLAAYRAMGAAILDGYLDTLLGRAMANLLRVIGFRRVIDRLPRSLASNNNYQTATLNWLGPREVELTMSDAAPHAGINLGVLERAFTHHFQAPGFEIVIAREQRPGATYRFKWTE